MANSPFDWKVPVKSVFSSDTKFNGVNLKKSAAASVTLDVNRDAMQLDLRQRKVTPYTAAGPYKDKPKKAAKPKE